MGRKPTEILEHVLDRADRNKVHRKDFEQRLKSLRSHGLYPPARAVGSRKAGSVTDEHLANVVLAFAASPFAVDVGERVDVLRRQKSTHSATGTEAEFRIGEGVAGKSLGKYLAGEIRSLRQGQKPVVEALEVAWRGGEVWAGVVLEPFEKTQDGAWRPRLLGFGSSRLRSRGPGPEISIMIKADLLQVMADFLGPIEDTA